jgi:CheY-like chemotaxis protein
MATTLEAKAGRGSSSGPSSLLVVEDDPNDIVFIRRGLSKAGVDGHVQVVRDGEDAIAYLTGEGRYHDRALYPVPALMLLDLKIPKKSGLEVLEWLRTDGLHKDLPVIILTSSREARDVARANELGVTAFHTKPVDLKELTALVMSIGLLWITLAK